MFEEDERPPKVYDANDYESRQLHALLAVDVGSQFYEWEEDEEDDSNAPQD